MPATTPLTLLNINDEPARRYFITHAARRVGFEVIECTTGTEAIRRASKDIPAVIVLDVKLPDLDGFEVCRRIKADPVTAAIPVILYSAYFTEDEDKLRGLDVADGYLAEPVNPSMVEATLRALLRARRAEHAARAAEAGARFLFDTLPLPAWVFDRHTLALLRVNDAAVKLFGYSHDHMLTMRAPDLQPPEDREAVAAVSTWTSAETTGPSRLRTHAGEVRDVELFARPLLVGGGDVCLVVAHDVTEQRRAEAKVTESERLLRDILDHSDAIVYLKDTDGRYITVNRRYEELTHTRRSEIRGKTDHDIFPRHFADIYRANDAQVLEQRRPVHVEERVLLDNVVRTFLEVKFPVLDADGAVYAVCGIGTDITDRKQAEERLRESEERFRTIFEKGPLGMALVGTDGRVRQVNTPFARMLRSTEGQLVGRPFADFTHPDDSQRDLDLARRLLAGALPSYEIETRYLREDGDIVWAHVTASVVRDEWGAPLYAIAVAQDITERKRVENEYVAALKREQVASLEAQEARDTAQAANRAKDDFLAMLSHELRTPLNVMVGYLAALRSGKMPAASVSETLERVERATYAQTRLVNDLLDVSRIVSGKLEIILQAVDLTEIVRYVVESYRSEADAKQLRLETDLTMRPLPAAGDRVRLEQAVGNLLGNAIKFTPGGGRITVRLTQVANRAHLTITDTGEGISPGLLPHVFERFRQADSASGHRVGGLGLGLTIVRHVVDQHGGVVSAQSAGPGRGATFTIELPLRPHRPDA